MTWAEGIQILLTGIAAVGSLLCLAVLLGTGRRLERIFADADRGELDGGMGTALESTQRWNDIYERGEVRSS